jgi:hypothetical protein
MADAPKPVIPDAKYNNVYPNLQPQDQYSNNGPPSYSHSNNNNYPPQQNNGYPPQPPQNSGYQQAQPNNYNGGPIQPLILRSKPVTTIW